jgi:hypothetical protein
MKKIIFISNYFKIEFQILNIDLTSKKNTNKKKLHAGFTCYNFVYDKL